MIDLKEAGEREGFERVISHRLGFRVEGLGFRV